MARAGVILMDEKAVSLAAPGGGAPHWQIRWADVAEVATWKLDLFAFDLLCLGLRPEAGADYLTCNESHEGWVALLHELKRRFGVKEEAWWPAVVVPAFEENFTLLWRC